MARKKGISKKSVRRSRSKTKARSSSRSSRGTKSLPSLKSAAGYKKRIGIVTKNLVLFLLLFVLSLLLYNVSVREIYVNLFLMLTIVFGFIGLSFIIVLLSLLFMRWLGK